MVKEASISGYASGDTLRITITVQDANGNAVDIRNTDITYAIAQDQTADTFLVEKTVSGGGITITDGANGKMVVEIDPSDTADLSGTFPHECEIVDSDGDVATIFSGEIEIATDLIE